jgi:hypothetical protein
MQLQLTDVEIAWLAGLFEGEGSCGFYDRGMAVYIGMTDRDVIERVQKLFPGPQGIRVRNRVTAGTKPLWEWRIRRRELVAEFLCLILPHLGQRRSEQARKLIAVAEDPKRGYGSGHRNKTHCRNGHPYDEANTSINDEGHRSCRTCRRNQTRKRRLAACQS